MSGTGDTHALIAQSRFDEADARLAPLVRDHPGDARLAFQYALVAVRKGDWAESLRRWQEAAPHQPGNIDVPIGLAEALRNLGRLDEAGSVLAKARAQFGDDARLFAPEAMLASCMRNWQDAASAWGKVAQHVPAHANAPLLQGLALLELRRFAEAETAFAEALRRTPSDTVAAFHHADLAARREDWEEVAHRWQQVAPHQPFNIDACIGLSHALSTLGRAEAAEAVLAEAEARFSNEPNATFMLAAIAMKRRAWPQAIALWQEMLARNPNDGRAMQGLGTALMELGKLEEAQAVLAAACRQAPTAMWPAVYLARVATLNGDMEESLKQWSHIKKAFGDAPAILNTFKDTLHRGKLLAADRMAALTEADAAYAEKIRTWQDALETLWLHSDTREVLLKFEGFGGGCEFGLVQRHFGAEPLGLLRWAGIPVAGLVAALRCRFEGLGDAANTDIDIFEDQEYAAIDKRFDMRTHTRVMAHQAARDAVLRQQCRRLRFLRDKFLEDLALGEKILVYAVKIRLRDDEIDALFDALSQYGANTLLCVRPEEAGHPNGSVLVRRPGLLVGYLDRLWQGGAAPVAYASWLKLCQATLDAQQGIIRQ